MQAQGGGAMVPATERTDIAVAAPPPMSIEEFRQRTALVKAVVAEMEIEVHYGQIPGTHDKNLWEPGAEYLRAAFRISWDYIVLVSEENFETWEFRYRHRAMALNPDGSVYSAWEGTAWSKERRFWCKKTCPKPCAQDHDPFGMEREMLPHNVSDRSLKRAFVAMIRNVTGTSGYFKMATGDDVESRKTTSTASGSAQSSPDSDKHPWLVTCPEHDVEWFQSEKMRSPGHKPDDGPWCNLPPVINRRARQGVDAAAGILGWDKKQADAWVKGEYNDTWSKLTPEDHISASAALGALAEKKLSETVIDEDEQTEGVQAEGHGTKGEIETVGELLQIAHERWGMSREQVCGALGQTSPTAIKKPYADRLAELETLRGTSDAGPTAEQKA